MKYTVQQIDVMLNQVAYIVSDEDGKQVADLTSELGYLLNDEYIRNQCMCLSKILNAAKDVVNWHDEGKVFGGPRDSVQIERLREAQKEAESAFWTLVAGSRSDVVI